VIPVIDGPAVDPALRLAGVVKAFASGAGEVRAVDGVSLIVPRGQRVAVVGRSGSGKSTLLHLIAGLEPPTSGEIWVNGVDLGRLGDDERTRRRRESIGIVYQFFNLLPTLSVLENVALPALLGGAPLAEATGRARELVRRVGLESRADARPHTLSGGEMQRAAIARALVHRPAVILADEPTGNLDTRSSAQVMELLAELTGAAGATLVLVTHSLEAAKVADRVVELSDGRIATDTEAA
jgi:ABC-type lipoprotein export system ATPase subunit